MRLVKFLLLITLAFTGVKYVWAPDKPQVVENANNRKGKHEKSKR